MRLNGEHTFTAARQQVWNALQDPNVLSSCLPGCQSFNPVGETEYETTLKIGIAAVKGTYTAKIGLSEQNEPESFRLTMSGKGTPGFLNGSGVLTLHDHPQNPEHTQVIYEGNVDVGGPIASVGQRMLGGVARMLISQFWKCMEQAIANHQAHAGDASQED